jgi:membrane associated rhomboid family serine protease
MRIRIGRYKILDYPFSTLTLAAVIAFFIAKISYESSHQVSPKEFIENFAIVPAHIFSTDIYKFFCAPFVTLGYWEVFVYIFFILVFARKVEEAEGTIKTIRVFLESYAVFILFSYAFFKNFHIWGLWFHIFGVLWFYSRDIIDERWFKYGYPAFCVIFAILVLHSGRTEYWKLGHLSGLLCVYLDEKLYYLIMSYIDEYREKKLKNEKYLTEQIEQQLDIILDKIHRLGYDSLTKVEKEILFKASRMYKDRIKKNQE